VFDLKGKRAVVTGAASGIGLAIAELFSAHQATVVLFDLDAQKTAEAAKAIAEKTAGSTTGIACDVSSAASVEQAFSQIGAVDILVN
jgi:2-keto-3-deoxy-L-fuconate dehydrogenase